MHCETCGAPLDHGIPCAACELRRGGASAEAKLRIATDALREIAVIAALSDGGVAKFYGALAQQALDKIDWREKWLNGI